MKNANAPVTARGFVQSLKNAARPVVAFGEKHAPKLTAGVLVIGGACQSALAVDPDATSIATNAQTAFGVVAPITITIVGFYVVLKIAKRVVS